MLEETVAFLSGPGLPFTPSSLEYKQASMLVFAAFVTFIAFGSYIVENMLLGFYPLAAVETAMFVIILGAYLDFRRRYNVRRAMLLLIFAGHDGAAVAAVGKSERPRFFAGPADQRRQALRHGGAA